MNKPRSVNFKMVHAKSTKNSEVYKGERYDAPVNTMYVYRDVLIDRFGTVPDELIVNISEDSMVIIPP